ncbi:MAG TPA: efflux RND transporter periplasmic adaptor subunit [Burkholderiaceae bacterium]|nr:efflux RND transporter periplasmic adaptor subunit [Burkholderiaceae bacterium]
MIRRPSNLSVRPLAAAALLALAIAAAGCSPSGGKAEAAAAASPPPDPMQITADEALMKRLRIEGVSTQSVTEMIRVAGRLDVNEYRTSRVGSPIEGRIVDIEVQLGERVRQGQTLAEVSSPELAQAQLDYLRATSRRQLLASAVERARALLDADVIGSVEVQRRQNEYDVAIAERRAAADRLVSLGMSRKRLDQLEATGQIQSKTSINASIGGTVIERNVTRGQAINTADTAFVVSDLDHLWALAEVPEQDARFVRPGQKVQVEIPALGSLRVEGKVAFVADVVTPATRTVRVGVDLDNPQRLLKPSMLMTMLVQGPTRPAQVVPADAVVRDGDRDFVFLEIGENSFRMTPVDLGVEHEGRRTLVKPLPDEARVVADGAFHLNNMRIQRNVGR